MSRTLKRGRPAAGRTAEGLFEDYLQLQGVAYQRENEYVPPAPGIRRRPDYRLDWNGDVLFCEVKELHKRRPWPAGAASFDPYGGIRKEIHEARKQFREYRGELCVLVVFNLDDWEFRDRPYVVYGAMLGDLGFSWNVSLNDARVVKPGTRSVFLDRGKMLHKGRPQNTTFSAIAVLSEYTIPNPAFEAEYQRRLAVLAAGLDRDLTVEDRVGTRMALYDCLPRSLGRCPRLSVFENPLASKKLPTDPFRGKYDARYRFSENLGRVERVFVGNGLRAADHVDQQDADILQKIERFKQAIVEHFSPEKIILFGSHAYGTAEPGSDVDLLVVFPGKRDVADRSLEIRRRFNPDFALDLLTRSAGEIDRRIRLGDCFLKEIIDNGMTLYEASHS